MKTYISLIGEPILLRRKIGINGIILTLYPTENGILFLNSAPPPRDTGIPLKHDYIFIKEVDTPNGISYHGGNDVIHDFWYLGKGGMKVTRY